MREAGVDIESDIRHTAVVGPFEAISHLGKLYKVFFGAWRNISKPNRQRQPSSSTFPISICGWRSG